MKVVNVILSVLVLLLAAVSAVFSYMLYEKRAEVAKGFGDIASAVQVSSKAMDRNSGTNVAAGLTDEKIAVNATIADREKALRTYKKQVSDIVAQRDDLATKMYNVGSSVSAGVGADDLKNVASSEENADKVVAGVKKNIRNRNAIYSDLENRFGVNRSELLKGNKNALNPIKTKINTLQSSLNRIAEEAGTTDANEVAAVLKDQKNKINKLTSEKNRASSERDMARREANSANAKVKMLNGQIREYKRLLGIADQDTVVLWGKGSDAARARMVGKVTKVNEEYGYIVIDQGFSSAVQQKIGKRTISVPLDLASGLELTVLRGKDFVAVIKLDKVGEKESTALIPPAKADKIKVGDMVIFKGKDK